MRRTADIILRRWQVPLVTTACFGHFRVCVDFWCFRALVKLRELLHASKYGIFANMELCKHVTFAKIIENSVFVSFSRYRRLSISDCACLVTSFDEVCQNGHETYYTIAAFEVTYEVKRGTEGETHECTKSSPKWSRVYI